MNRVLVLLSLSLLLTAVGAGAQSTPAGAEDVQAVGQPAPPLSPAVSPLAGSMPEPIFLAECTVFRWCVCPNLDHCPISCSGTTCSQGPGRGITCDGVTTECGPIATCCLEQ